MKIVIPGGRGQVGRILVRAFQQRGDECVVLSRAPATPPDPAAPRQVAWDGRTPGDWVDEIEGADVVINLAGRSVNCRYHERNLREMMASRVDSTRAIGMAIAKARRPPPLWIQAGTATIYAHRFDAANDEAGGVIGGDEPNAPPLWRRSVEIARAWEAAALGSPTPRTRRVLLRSAMIMSPDRGGVFDAFACLCRLGFGRCGHGRQYVSWIHEYDFIAALQFLMERSDLAGIFNLAAPRPLTNREFMAALGSALGRHHLLPVPGGLLEIGAWMKQTETELLMKSRRVVPGRLLENGFGFRFPDWPIAAEHLAALWRHRLHPEARSAAAQ